MRRPAQGAKWTCTPSRPQTICLEHSARGLTGGAGHSAFSPVPPSADLSCAHFTRQRFHSHMNWVFVGGRGTDVSGFAAGGGKPGRRARAGSTGRFLSQHVERARQPALAPRRRIAVDQPAVGLAVKRLAGIAEQPFGGVSVGAAQGFSAASNPRFEAAAAGAVKRAPLDVLPVAFLGRKRMRHVFSLVAAVPVSPISGFPACVGRRPWRSCNPAARACPGRRWPPHSGHRPRRPVPSDTSIPCPCHPPCARGGPTPP